MITETFEEKANKQKKKHAEKREIFATQVCFHVESYADRVAPDPKPKVPFQVNPKPNRTRQKKNSSTSNPIRTRLIHFRRHANRPKPEIFKHEPEILATQFKPELKGK